MEAGINASATKWLQLYFGGNVYDYKISGTLFDSLFAVHNSGWVYSFNSNISFVVNPTLSIQFNVNYTSKIPTAQGENSYFLSPNTSIKKTFLQGRLTATLQWQNMDMGLNKSNIQRITTSGYNFYSTTNYIVEPDIVLLNLGFNLKQNNKKIKLPSSEFGDKEF